MLRAQNFARRPDPCPITARYAAGTREILEAFLAGKPIRTEYLIVDKGKLPG